MDRDTLQDLAYTISETYEDRYIGRFQSYGICGRCRDFKYRKTKHMMEMEVWCDSYNQNNNTYIKVVPNCQDPVIDCSDFYPKGQMTLESMSRIAALIDTKERKVGFGCNTEREIIITKPGEDQK